MNILDTKHTNIQKQMELLEERENIIIYGEISSNIKQGDYKDSFYIDVFKIELNNNKEINLRKKDIKLIVYIEDVNKYEIMQGDYIKVVGNLSTISSYNNFDMFNYKEYMNRKNIYGNIYSSNLITLEKKNNKVIYARFKLINYIKNKIKNNIHTENNGLLTGILIGDKEDISDEKIEEFKNSNLSHILAVSGTHVSILITLVTMVLNRILKDYKIKNVIIIAILIFFLFIIGSTPSVLRAVIMSCLVLISKLVYRKSNNINNLFISAFIILLLNPYYLFDLGFELSFLATLGIILFVREFEKIIPYIVKQSKVEDKNLKIKITKYIISTIIVSISANLLIIPVILYNTNNISFNFIISNIIISPLIFILEMLGIIFLIVPNISILNYLIEIILYLISSTARYCSKIKIFSFLLTTPSIIQIFIYYLLIYFTYRLIINKILRIKIKLYIERASIFIRKNKYKIISMLIVSSVIIFITSKIYILNSKLEIHFLDVSQGDSTLIITNKRKSILIDGGGNESYDIGKNILKPYLLKRKIKVLDYIIISHMDFDHCGGILTLIEEIKVKNIIMGKQFESSKNYEKFIEIAKNKKAKVFIVEAGQRINIENDLYFDVLWPDSKKVIDENILNNNSLVCKLNYKKFSILFTGDIEEVAEKAIIQKYSSKSNILNSLVLKVAHHGSKTSTMKDILMTINPKIALIGVGKNNKFGHPSDITLENLNGINTQIYRTDKDGEIIMKTDGNEIEIDKFIK